MSSPCNRLRSSLKFNLTRQVEFRAGKMHRIGPVKYSQGVKVFPRFASWVLKSPQTWIGSSGPGNVDTLAIILLS